MEEEANQDVGQDEEALTEENVDVSQEQDSVTEQPSGELGGDGDWFNPKNYAEDFDRLPPEIQAKLSNATKGMASAFGKKMQGIAKSTPAKKFGFDSVDELVDLAQNNPELVEALTAKQQQEAQVQEQLTRTPAENLQTVANNWNNLSKSQQQSYYSTLTPEQQLNLSNAVALRQQQMNTQNAQNEQLHQENVKKYGESYKKIQPKMEQIWKEQSSKNPWELAYKAINYDEAIKEAYQKGLREKSQRTAQTISLANSGKASESIPKKSSFKRGEAINAALEKVGLSFDKAFPS